MEGRRSHLVICRKLWRDQEGSSKRGCNTEVPFFDEGLPTFVVHRHAARPDRKTDLAEHRFFAGGAQVDWTFDGGA